ncbi:unnamed protein product, partial [Ectocarpus sp. 13 AM-2016]
NSNSLVVIKFFAPWCRSCKALDVKYRRMAVENEDVKFVEVRERNVLYSRSLCVYILDADSTSS